MIKDLIGIATTKEQPGFYHVGAIVHDLKKGVDFFNHLPGIAEWEYLDVAYSDDRDENRIAEPLKIAKSHVGPVGYEVIQPLSDTSYWGKVLTTRGAGIHHIAYAMTSSFDQTVADLKAKGYVSVWESTTLVGGKTYYFAPEDGNGLVLEILQRWPRNWPKSEDEITAP